MPLTNDRRNLQYSMPNVLFVGHVCMDMISECLFYPPEDNKIGSTTLPNRCVSQRWQRGGNASNNATVFSIITGKSSFAGTIADSVQKSFLLNDFQQYNIDLSDAHIIPNTECPSSCVISSQATGSRTIIHSNQNLPELSLDMFKEIDLSKYDWIHFEGRNLQNLKSMIENVVEFRNKSEHIIKISVEIEKAKSELEELFMCADVLFISKDFALYKGYKNMKETAEKISSQCKEGTIVICPWGEEGACAIESTGSILSTVAYPPENIVDTLGAGDTFIASTIFAMCLKVPIIDCIEFGCRIAGIKIGVRGWQEFKDILNEDTLKKCMSKWTNSPS